MTQSTLDFSARKMARTTDPATSHEAAELMVIHAGSQRDVFLQLVKANPGLTSTELGELSPYTVDKRRTIAGRRLPELRAGNWIRNGEDRPCRVTGLPEMTWWPVR